MPIPLHRPRFLTTLARLEGSRFGFMILALLGAAVCGPGEAPVAAVPPGEATVAETSAVETGEVASGIYEVRGVTVQAADGRQRGISGTLQLDVESGRYEVTFDLATTSPDAEASPATVTGSGRGWVVNAGPDSPAILAGTTEEEMAIAPAPGAEPGEDHATVGVRIVSTSQAYMDEEGALVVHLQNQAPAGVPYSPSVTTLVGRRVGGLGGVAAGPPSED